MFVTPPNRRPPNLVGSSNTRTLINYAAGRLARFGTNRIIKNYRFPKSKPRVYPKNNMGKGTMGRISTNVINAQAGRASMKRKFTKNEKVKSTKRVKVSKALREKVKKVIAGEDAYGQYNVRYGGTIGYVDPGADTGNTRVTPYARDANFVLSFWGGTTFPVGSKVWFAAHHANIGAGTAANMSSAADRVFAYFTPLKILDAASVLWNKKPATANPTLVTGNFSLSTGLATGTPQVGSSQFPQTGPQVIKIINSYVTWRMKNTSQRSVVCKIYHCVPKLKFCDKGPLTILAGLSETLDTIVVTTPTLIRELNGLPLNLNGSVASSVATHPMFEPNIDPNFASAFKYSLKIINLKPGEECVHSIQGPKNYTLDYNKLHSEGESKVGSFFKDTTIMPMVSVELDSAFATTGSGQFGGQYYNKTTNAAASLINPISIEVDEVFKLSCPSNAGFIQRSAATGETQQLSLKTKRQLYVNWNLAPAAADTYTIWNEENIASGIVKNTFN